MLVYNRIVKPCTEAASSAEELLAAAVQVYVPGMRSKALVHMMRTAAPVMLDGGRRATHMSLKHYARLLQFDSPHQAKEFILLHEVRGTSQQL